MVQRLCTRDLNPVRTRNSPHLPGQRDAGTGVHPVQHRGIALTADQVVILAIPAREVAAQQAAGMPVNGRANSVKERWSTDEGNLPRSLTELARPFTGI